MKNKLGIAICLILLISACSESLPELESNEETRTGDSVENERIQLINERIQLIDNEMSTQSMSANTFSFESNESPTFSCSSTIYTSFSGNKDVDRDVVCLSAGTTFNGSVELKGGTFVISGNATITNINGNKGKIVVTETGSLSMNQLNINNNFEIENYGQSFNVARITVSGSFKNHGTVTVNDVTVNGGGEFESSGVLDISGSFTANDDAENSGKMTVGGKMTVNGGATFKNACQLIINGDFQNNKTIENYAYLKVSGRTTLNGGAKIELEPQAYFITENLTMNGSINGSDDGYARVDVIDNSTINWGARITGNVDFNDANGIELDNSRKDNSVIFDGDFTIETTDCNPGTTPALIYPEYTLVADIAVPQAENSPLSATDVACEDGLAIISYHLNGPEFSGAIDLLDISALSSPKFTMNFLSLTKEFNAVVVDDNKLYLAGQRNVDESGYTANNTSGALLYEVDVLGNSLLESTNEWNEVPMPSFSGNTVSVLDNAKLLFGSGATGGGFFEVNTTTNTITKSELVDYAKYVFINETYKLKLIGGLSSAKLMVESNGVENEVDLGASAIPEDGKNVVACYDDKAYVSLGGNGLVVVDLLTTEVVQRYNPEISGLTNGVAVDDDFVYLANGESGLLLLRRDSLDYYGQYKYDGSANLVEVVDNVILIANGIGGVKLLVRTE